LISFSSQTGEDSISNSNNINTSSSQILKTPVQEELLPVDKNTSNWILEKKTQLSSSIAKFEFKCKGYFINLIQQDIKFLGKHMKVSHVSQAKIRLYTLVMSQTYYRTEKRTQLLKKFFNNQEASGKIFSTKTYSS